MTSQVERPSVRDLSILLIVVMALALGLPTLELFVTRNDMLLSLVGTYTFLAAVLASVVLAGMITYRLLFGREGLARMTLAVLAAIVAFLVTLPGSVYLSSTLCSTFQGQCIVSDKRQ